MMISGNETSTTAASTGESSTIATPVSTSSRMLPTTSISTCRVNVVRVWTSEVSRAINTPARSLSKKGMESR